MRAGHLGPKTLDADRTLIERHAQAPELAKELPDWLFHLALAEKWGLAPDALAEVPQYWIDREAVRMQAQAFIQDQQAQMSAPKPIGS